MPLWFKCPGCGKKFYTADSSRKENENFCPECESELEIVQKENFKREEINNK